jgi:hypothetical protein
VIVSNRAAISANPFVQKISVVDRGFLSGAAAFVGSDSIKLNNYLRVAVVQQGIFCPREFRG